MFIFDLVLLRGKLNNQMYSVMKDLKLLHKKNDLIVSHYGTSNSFIAPHFPKSLNTFRFPIWVR